MKYICKIFKVVTLSPKNAENNGQHAEAYSQAKYNDHIYIYIYHPDYLYCTQGSRSEESNQVILLSECSIMRFEVPSGFILNNIVDLDVTSYCMAQIYPLISQPIQQLGKKLK